MTVRTGLGCDCEEGLEGILGDLGLEPSYTDGIPACPGGYLWDGQQCYLSDVTPQQYQAAETIQASQPSPGLPLSVAQAWVTQEYQTRLNRAPDPAGYAGWVNALVSGTSTESQVDQGFLNSPEYISLHTASAPSAGASMTTYMPTVTLDDPSSAGYFAVGDSFTIRIGGGQPNSPVSVSENGGSPYPMGSTDSSGRFSTAGSWKASDAGNYSQVWYVNGVPTNSINFAVTAKVSPGVASPVQVASTGSPSPSQVTQQQQVSTPVTGTINSQASSSGGATNKVDEVLTSVGLPANVAGFPISWVAGLGLLGILYVMGRD